MHDLAELAGALAWPCVTLFGLLLFRGRLVRILTNFADRIPTADKISITRDGLALEGRLAAVEIKTNLAAGQAYAQRGLAPAAQDTIPADLQDLSDRYGAVNIADYTARVFGKDRLADEMGRMVVDRHVSRDKLAASGEPGLFAALVTAVIARPEPADFSRVQKVAGATDRKHVQYRAVLALIELMKRQFVQPQQKGDVVAVLNRLKKVDDASLQRLITQVEPLLATSFADLGADHGA